MCSKWLSADVVTDSGRQMRLHSGFSIKSKAIKKQFTELYRRDLATIARAFFHFQIICDLSNFTLDPFEANCIKFRFQRSKFSMPRINITVRKTAQRITWNMRWYRLGEHKSKM